MNLHVLNPTRSGGNGTPDGGAAEMLTVDPPGRREAGGRRLVPRLASYLLRLVVVACLAIDAYVHLNLAHDFDPLKASISQGTLFRYEATAAILAGALLLITGRTFAWIFAFGVLAAGFTAVMVYQYVDIGAFGPFPEMYDPYWTFQKAMSVVAEGVGAVLAGTMVVLRLRTWWRARAS